jgi:tetratricopeptide (TPR) repeat protein
VTLHRTAGESAITRQLSDAFIGHHLEQAFVISSELEPVTNEWQAVAQEASQRLATAGRAERARGAQPAAIALFRRAARLHTEPDWQSVNTLIDLAESLGQVGATRDAKETTERVVELSSNLDARIRARVELFRTREMVTLEGSTDPQVESSLRDLIPVFADQDDHTGLTKIYLAIGQLQWNIGLCAATAASLNIALGHCLQMPTQRDLHVLISGLAAALFWGPTPTSDAIRESHRLLEIASGDPLAGAVLNLRLAGLHSMQENFADARSLARSSFATLEEFGQDLKAAAATQNSALIEIFAGDLSAAHDELRRGYDALGQLGITSYHRTNSSMLGRVLHDLGRSDDAVPFLDEAEEAGADDPSIGTMTWPVRAEIAAADGDEETARRFIGQARSMAARSDAVIEKAFIEGPAVRAFTRLGLNDEADKARQNLAALAQQKEAPALLGLAGVSS